jgi:hypothetical protein
MQINSNIIRLKELSRDLHKQINNRDDIKRDNNVLVKRKCSSDIWGKATKLILTQNGC